MQIFYHHFTNSYHDRHQTAHYPLYYGEQQDPGRESNYWPVPGSRTGGAPQDYANWTDPELSAATTSSHFPFILERHTKQHPDLSEYQAHEARDREWTAAQRAAREYERGFLREGWQRRWEPCSPVRYNNREVSLKRSDSSYRELEAWAARYSHSLPRRRRIEAELRGASQGLMDSSRAQERDGRSGTDPRLAALQQARQCANIREPGVWDRGGRQQTLGYYPAQAPAPDTSHMLDIKEKTAYQRRMFSQPPGYIAPPPYSSPHKSPPVMHHCDLSWEQDGKRQTYWSQPTLRKQDVSPVDLQEKRRVEKEEFTKLDGNKRELDGLKHRGPELNILQVSSPNNVQNTLTQPECVPSLQQPQIIPAIQDIKTNEQTSSKVIEGRKFRLNKKTGGLTIFCLVSRIADATETPSLPICTSQSNIQSTEVGEVSKSLGDVGDIHQAQKLADEVDFRSTTLTEQSNISDTGSLEGKQTESPTCVESEMLGDNLANKAETDVVSPEKTNLNDAMSTSGKQVAQSIQSVKYPLWREPSFTSKVETESLSTALKANSEEAELDGPQDQEECDTVQPVDAEGTSLDNEEDTQESEDNKAIDTTCVVVKMELIPSPRKEHVHYIGSSDDSPLDNQSNTVCPEANSLLSQDETLDTQTNPFQVNENYETQLESDLGETKAPDGCSELSFPCIIPSSSISEKETLAERAERILGIPLHDCITEDQPEDVTSLLDPCVEKQDVEVEPCPVTNGTDDATEQLPVDTREEEVGQIVDESDDAEDEAKNRDDEEFAEPQEQVSCLSEEIETDSQLDTQISQETEMAEDLLLEPTTNVGTTEQSQEQDDPSSEHPFECLSVATDSSDPCLSSHSNPAALSESNTEDGLDVPDTAENLVPPSEPSSPADTPSLHPPFHLPPESTEASTSHTLHSPDLPPVDLMDQTADAISGIENQDEEGETSQLTQELLEYEQPDNMACVERDTDDQQVKDVDPTGILEQTLETSKENTEDVSILQQQLQCAEAENAVCCVTEEPLQQEETNPAELLETLVLEENTTDNQTQEKNDDSQEEDSSTEEQAQKQASEDTGLSAQTSEISTETATEVTILQQQCVKDSDMSEKQSPIEDIENPVELLDQTTSREDEIEILQNVEAKIEPSDFPSPLPSNSEASQSPLDVLSPPDCLSPLPVLPKSETEPASIMETDLVTADACVSETVPPPPQPNSYEEFLQFSSSSTSESDPSLVSSTSIFPLDGVEGVSLDLPDKEESQYPKSLWDAVNRIRKHTAPDSENEEEEVSEQWDPESLGEEVSCPDMVLDMNSERRVFDEHKVSTESVDNVGQDPGHKEPSRHAEEDTLSCSSISSSGDTVIIAEEDNVEETQQDAASESKTEAGEEFAKAAGEQGCSGEVNDETRTKEVAEDKLDVANTKDSCLNEECTAERVEAMEIMEMDQKENAEGLTSTEVAVVSDEITD